MMNDIPGILDYAKQSIAKLVTAERDLQKAHLDRIVAELKRETTARIAAEKALDHTEAAFRKNREDLESYKELSEQLKVEREEMEGRLANIMQEVEHHRIKMSAIATEPRVASVGVGLDSEIRAVETAKRPSSNTVVDDLVSKRARVEGPLERTAGKNAHASSSTNDAGMQGPGKHQSKHPAPFCVSVTIRPCGSSV
ncbi:hypothetical protein B0H11DRAFT_1993940 [Mycena galericulata]|nr:hypothetical protein B0H11DRAFT_1993940 [Mycena galericulata]